MKLIITETNNIDEFMESDIFKQFANECEIYRKQIEKEYFDSLKNDIQKKIFTDWCNGLCVCLNEYVNKNNISKEDDYEAHSAILSVISLGLG